MYIHKRHRTRISDSQYNILPYFEKDEYYREESSSEDIVDTIVDVGIGMAIGYGISEIFGNDSSSSDSSSSNDSSF